MDLILTSGKQLGAEYPGAGCIAMDTRPSSILYMPNVCSLLLLFVLYEAFENEYL